MKRPKQINIAGTLYNVIYRKKVNGKKLYGKIDYEKKEIVIWNGESGVHLWKTIFHEILHGIEEEFHLKCFSGKRGHDELDIIASQIVDVCFRNGWFPQKR